MRLACYMLIHHVFVFLHSMFKKEHVIGMLRSMFTWHVGNRPEVGSNCNMLLEHSMFGGMFKVACSDPSPLTAATASTHLHSPRASPHPATYSTVITINPINLRLFLINQVKLRVFKANFGLITTCLRVILTNRDYSRVITTKYD